MAIPPSSQPRIAVVDDDRSIREALQDMLQSYGYSCSTFDSAKAFLGFDSASDFDCIILDVSMPEIDGLELQASLRTAGLNVPIVFVTSHDDDRTRDAALAGGALAFLGKPVDLERLLHFISIAMCR
ncbi:response regulator transcription factor [Rhizobium mesosinicum]|uniref:Response regulator n=1 Tax=Rhizobium mesosinicum TaxID=335017 RepID=A0ABS7GMA1_9HYPH|nr:response regulator [Rhizobium mesosinicum]MBW9051104.1 response regulator [Rhizobium mesosinicum]